jgi:hypothetical protein
LIQTGGEDHEPQTQGDSGRVVALLLVLVAAVVSNWSSLTSSSTTSPIRSDLADYARTGELRLSSLGPLRLSLAPFCTGDAKRG